MKEDSAIPDFSMLGGPLHRLGCRLGLVRDVSNTVGVGLALGLLVWGILVVLALIQGVSGKVFSLSVIGAHVRLLVAIPLFFLCEAWVFPRMAEFAREIVSSGMVPASELPALGALVHRVGRGKDSPVPEALFLLVAFVFPLVAPSDAMSGSTGNWGAILAQAGGRVTWVNGWYLGACLPLFRFLMMRWLWRLGLWWYFLWRVEKLDLHLVPTHPDGAGGLGFLEIVQDHFVPLMVAIGAVYAASFAEGISTGAITFDTLGRLIPMVLTLVTALFIGPLVLFSGKLWRCRVSGWSAYMAMASRYVDAFERKWVRDESATGDAQLGTADLQSLADLGNSMNVVRGMRLVPASQRLVVGMAASVLLPMLPLLLLKYPVDQLVIRFVQTLTGL